MDLNFTRGSRNIALAMILIGIMALFAMRLFYVQVIRHDYYVSQADTLQIKPFTLHAKRGEIYTYDNGSPEKFVMNETVYIAWVDPTQVTDKQAIVDALNEVAGGNSRKNFSQYIEKKDTRYQVLATKVSRKQAELLKEKNIAGLGFDAVSQRVYPEGQLASQVLGFVDSEGNGKYGFEQAKDEELQGVDGVLKTVTDVRAVPLTIGAKNINKPAKDGKNYVLSLDRYIQARVEKALADGISRSGATSASAVVIDPQTGRVMAMANLPSYDPTLLATVTDPALFNNGVISSPYEPGSVIKTFTVATGVDRSAISPETTFNNTDSVRVEDQTITNASKGRTGERTMQYALDWSLNTGMVEIAKRLGNGDGISRSSRDTMYAYFHDRFRLGQVTGIELANEAGGTVVSPEQTEGNAVRYSNMAFGQGMDATMLQVAAGFSGAVNGGTYRTPTIIAGSIDDNGVYRDAQPRQSYSGIISPASSSTVREMVHQSHYATYKPQNEPVGYYVGGKTGTSQTIENGKYVSDETIGTYLGFGGEVNKMPRYVVMVEIAAKDKMMGGGADAKPIFNDISNWMIDYLKLQPQG